MTAKLSPVSSGVVHSSSHRTRLKVAKDQRTEHNAVVVKDAIEAVPGVEKVQINRGTGNVVIQHDDRPDILEHIGDAIAKAAPDVLQALVLGTRTDGVGLGLGGLWALGTVIGKFVGQQTDDAETAVEKPGVSNQDIKKYVPYAFLAAGLIQVLETEAILAGMAPLALFYYAFDTHWKFRQEAELGRMETELEKVKTKQDKVARDIKHIAQS